MQERQPAAAEEETTAAAGPFGRPSKPVVRARTMRAASSLLTALLVSCSGDSPAPRRAAPRIEAPAAVPHGDHDPHHGGVVLMHGDLHFEVVLDPGGRHRIYLSDAVRTELPASAATEVRITVSRPGEMASESLALQIDEFGESWVAQGKPVLREDSSALVSLVYQGEPYEIELPFLAPPPDPEAPDPHALH